MNLIINVYVHLQSNIVCYLRILPVRCVGGWVNGKAIGVILAKTMELESGHVHKIR